MLLTLSIPHPVSSTANRFVGLLVPVLDADWGMVLGAESLMELPGAAPTITNKVRVRLYYTHGLFHPQTSRLWTRLLRFTRQHHPQIIPAANESVLDSFAALHPPKPSTDSLQDPQTFRTANESRINSFASFPARTTPWAITVANKSVSEPFTHTHHPPTRPTANALDSFNCLI
ncbi:hypothetical protein GGU11DRAFT_838236 [Lentinula aff. detonsa]|nr:hypothetical protein GGU11DRAFT_838236 [Lentinula aff. detonsa]